jgi:hypothetical protein
MLSAVKRMFVSFIVLSACPLAFICNSVFRISSSFFDWCRGEFVGVLSPLPVNRLIGVGAKTTERMQALGINATGDLARYDVQKLIGVWKKPRALFSRCFCGN